MTEMCCIDLPDGTTEVIGTEDVDTAGPLTIAAVYLVGQANASPFLGYDPGTLIFKGLTADGFVPGRAIYHFLARSRPWDHFYAIDAGWRRYIDRQGRPICDRADFSPLPTERRQP